MIHLISIHEDDASSIYEDRQITNEQFYLAPGFNTYYYLLTYTMNKSDPKLTLVELYMI